MIIAITPPQPLNNESNAIDALIQHGVDFVHMRKPKFSHDEMKGYLSGYKSGVKPYLTLHGLSEVALQEKLGGFHGGVIDSLLINNELMRFSRSCHLTDELCNEPNIYHYQFLSPIFNSISKEGYDANFTKFEIEQGLNRAKQHNALKNIALGGIDESNAYSARMMGFDGIALLGGLWQIEDQEVNIAKTISKLKKILHAWNNQ